MLVKYGVEATLILFYTSSIVLPWDFLNPLLSVRTAILRPAPQWLPWALFLWTLPFLWVAVTMSVRRAADAGRSPWLGLVVLIPIVNLIFMLAMCFAPSQPGEQWSMADRSPITRGRVRSGAMTIGLSLLVGGVMLWISVYVFSTYGASLFLGTPMMMGATAAYLYNRPYPRSYGASMGIGLASVFFAGLGAVALCPRRIAVRCDGGPVDVADRRDGGTHWESHRRRNSASRDGTVGGADRLAIRN